MPSDVRAMRDGLKKILQDPTSTKEELMRACMILQSSLVKSRKQVKKKKENPKVKLPTSKNQFDGLISKLEQ